jgi:hypothetical protein
VMPECPPNTVCANQGGVLLCSTICLDQGHCRPEYECNGNIPGTQLKACRPKP